MRDSDDRSTKSRCSCRPLGVACAPFPFRSPALLCLAISALASHFLAFARARRLHIVRSAPATSTRRRPPPPSQSCSQARKTSIHSSTSGRHRLFLTSRKRPLRGGRAAPASPGLSPHARVRPIATDRVDLLLSKRLFALRVYLHLTTLG